ncbi:hypothetical protein ACS78O_16740 [Yersinia enterocolitica]|uniref:hypothetical protein n=1 Tax=Yersinia enterocolitica TaxID=630 RepID=UPI002A7A18C7|nr:hypothetical protein [Yersinia enterocolitica]
MLSKEPVRIRHDWDAAVVAICDFCSHSEMTVPHVDGGKICASCCDAETLSKWQSYAQDVVSELLSLREQLAELKALEPFGYIDSVRTDNWNYINLKGETSTVAFISKTADGLMRKDYAMPLFTAAKPAED